MHRLTHTCTYMRTAIIFITCSLQKLLRRIPYLKDLITRWKRGLNRLREEKRNGRGREDEQPLWTVCNYRSPLWTSYTKIFITNRKTLKHGRMMKTLYIFARKKRHYSISLNLYKRKQFAESHPNRSKLNVFFLFCRIVRCAQKKKTT